MSEIKKIRLNGTTYTIGGAGSELTENIKASLLAVANHVAWDNTSGQEYIDALDAALHPPTNLESISAVFAQGSDVIYDSDSLDTLKQYLTVTAQYSDSSSSVVTAYTLSGTLAEGTSTITVSYGGKSDNFNVIVTHRVTSEVISQINSHTGINQTTFETSPNPYTYNWVSSPGTIPASKVSFSWDPSVADLFKVSIHQFDENGTPYKQSAIRATADNPVTNGDVYDTAPGAWADAGQAYQRASFSGGNITINLPTSGIFLVQFSKDNTSTGEASSNDRFDAWLKGGGLTITAHI